MAKSKLDSVFQGLGFDVPAALQRTYAEVQRPVADMIAGFKVVREKIDKIAPKVIGLFNDLKAASTAAAGDGVTFVFADFARLFSPDVPKHPREKDGTPGYTVHPTYMALDYMRRTISGKRAATGRQGVRDLATDQIGRALRTVRDTLRVEDHPLFWAAVKAEFRINGQKSMLALIKRVEETEPLIDVAKLLKPIRFREDAVIHMASDKDRAVTNPTATVTDLAAVRDHIVGRGKRAAKAGLAASGQRVRMTA